MPQTGKRTLQYVNRKHFYSCSTSGHRGALKKTVPKVKKQKYSEGLSCSGSLLVPDIQQDEFLWDTYGASNSVASSKTTYTASTSTNIEDLVGTKGTWDKIFDNLLCAYTDRFWASTEDSMSNFCIDCGQETEHKYHGCMWHMSTSLVKEVNKQCYQLKSEETETLLLFLPLSHKEQCGCTHSEFHPVTVYDPKGRVRKCTIEKCQKDDSVAVTLIRHNLWPCSPTKPETAVHFSVMELIYSFVVATRTSLYRCCQALEAFASLSCKNHSTASSLYQALSRNRNLSFRIFRKFLQCVHYLRDILPEKELFSKSECAACPKDGGRVQICLDGCFQLVQKSKGSSSVTAADIKEWQFFCDQAEVDQFAKEHSKEKEKISEDCAQFSAGDIVSTARKNRNLAVKGVFGACCSHQFPLLFCDMKHGERYCYPKYILREMIKLKKIPSNSIVQVFYDIACKFKQHLELQGDMDLLDYEFYIGVFHSYAHSLWCQLNYNPRIKGHCGLTDGEGMERIWSMLQASCRCVKEMDSSNRVSFLNDILYAYGQQLNDKIDNWLLKRHSDATSLIQQASDELDSYMEILAQKSRGQIVKVTDLALEFEHLRDKFKRAKKRESSIPNWAKLYIGQIERFTKLQERNSFGLLTANELTELNKLDSDIENLEKSNGIQVRWQPTDFIYKNVQNTILLEKLVPIVSAIHKAAVERKQYTELLSKFVPGMQAFNKLNKLAENRMNELKKQVQKYNCSSKPSNLSLPKALKSSEICQLDSPEWVSLQQLKEECALDPLDSVKIAAIKQKGLLDSASFEKNQLEDQMNNVLKYYQSRSECLKKTVVEIFDIEKCDILWKAPILFYHQMYLEEKYNSMRKKFESVCVVSEVQGNEFDYADTFEQILSYDSDDGF